MIYLDNAATSFPKAPGVGESVANQIMNIPGNPGRGSFKSSVKASGMLFDLRENICELLGFKDSSRVIFTQNATHALNMAILGSVKNGEIVLTSPLEHNSVLRPLNYLSQHKSVKLRYLEFDTNFSLDMEVTEKIIAQVDRVICTACSNVTGTITPFQDIAKLCKKYNKPFILDASQLVGYKDLNFSDIPVSAVCFPGHKGLLGPSGTGALYFSEDFYFEPLYFGGTGSKSNSAYQPEFLPDKYESGTMNIAGLAGLNTSVEYLLSEGVSKIRDYKNELVTYLLNELQTISEVEIYSNQDIERQIGVISINIKDKSCSNVARILDENNICTRMGLHCAPFAHKFIRTFDVGGTVRLSPGYFTKEEEIKSLINVLKTIV